MPPEERIRLHNQQGLAPGTNAAGQQHQNLPVVLGEFGAINLALKDHQLLTQEHVFGDEFGFATVQVSQRANDLT